MKKGQKSVRNGIEDFLCPFTDMYITQGSNTGTHKGTMANDVRGVQKGVRYPYYAPCDCKLIWYDKSNGQGMWQSIKKVRFSNGNINYATFVTAHDETFDADKTMGQTIPQGHQLGNMGNKAGGGASSTGVHCHIEIAQNKYTIKDWHKNKYGIYCFPNETDTDSCYFVDNTNILNGMGGNWKKTSQVPVAPVNKKNYVNLPPTVNSWAIYKLNSAPVKKNAIGSLNPKKFGGLSYYIYSYRDNNTTVEINTINFGRVKIYIKGTPATITTGTYKYKNGVH